MSSSKLMPLLIVLLAPLLCHAERTGWRRQGDGQFPQAAPPRQWGNEENIEWMTELPGGGYSSPVVCGGRLLLTAEPATLLCLNAATGEELWRQAAGYEEALGEEQAKEIASFYEQIDKRRNELRQEYNELRKEDPDGPKTLALRERMTQLDRERKAYEQQYPQQKRGGAGNAAATVACDGENAYATFSTGIVISCRLDDGQRRWIRRVEASEIGFGHSTSPLLSDDKLIVHFRDLVALDTASGAERWRTELPAMHGTGVVATVGGEEVIVTPSGSVVRAAEGKVLAEKLFRLSHNSPLVHDGVIYAHEGGKVTAWRLPKSIDEPLEVAPLWSVSSTKDQRIASAVYHRGLLFGAARKGILDVIDAETGEEVYRQRLDIGELFAALTVADSLIYVVGRDGKTLVLRPGREHTEVARNELRRTSSTPYFQDDRMYYRADDRLYCIRTGGADGQR